jgi:pimeloyl-ACP methyl ester carboxylesterase
MLRTVFVAGLSAAAFAAGTAARVQGQGSAPPVTTWHLTEADCSTARLASSIPASAIGEPVSTVTLETPVWSAATPESPAFCTVGGSMAPATPEAHAQPIQFRVVLPAAWQGRAVQLGGGGMNGVVPNLTAPIDGGPTGPVRSLVTFGSDSGHRGGRGAPVDWSLNDEAIRNLGFMQMKKTRDAAMVLIERAYGSRPAFTYYVGNSQGGREALTVAQRYPDDYDGVISNVPIVAFSSLMLAPELIRIQEKPLANWVTPAKTATIRDHFMRSCDHLDGLVDGVMNNYPACRALFDVTQGAPGRRPWQAKRCANGTDPNPADSSPEACLTDGQIATLEFVYRPYRFATPLANGAATFGMWVPTTDPAGSGLIEATRFIGQEGAGPDAPMHAHLGVLGVTGFLMRNPAANPLDYVDGGAFNERRLQLSEWLDSTQADLSAFRASGGKMIVTIGTDDTLASPGAQLDYYRSVVETMGREAVASFARLFVMAQANHGLRAQSAARDGSGRMQPPQPLPSSFDRFAMLTDWVERGQAPPLHGRVTGGNRTMPLCSYPAYPHYVAGDATRAEAWECRVNREDVAPR